MPPYLSATTLPGSFTSAGRWKSLGKRWTLQTRRVKCTVRGLSIAAAFPTPLAGLIKFYYYAKCPKREPGGRKAHDEPAQCCWLKWELQTQRNNGSKGVIRVNSWVELVETIYKATLPISAEFQGAFPWRKRVLRVNPWVELVRSTPKVILQTNKMQVPTTE